MNQTPGVLKLLDQAWQKMGTQLPLLLGLGILGVLLSATTLVRFPWGISGLLLALQGVLAMGVFLCVVKVVAQGRIGFADFFWAFQSFPRLLHAFVLQLATGLAVFVGLIFLILPGIYIWVRLFAATPLFVLEREDSMYALRSSWQLTQNRFGYVARAALVFCGLNLFGLLFFGLGLVFTIPLSLLFQAEVVRALRQAGVVNDSPAPIAVQATT